MNLARCFAISAAVLHLAACGSMAPTAIRKDKVESVHRVAIIGFTLTNGVSGQGNEHKSSSGLMGMINSAKGVTEQVSGDSAARTKASVDGVYQALATDLAAKFHWEVVSLDDMAKSAVYAARLKDQPKSGMLDSGERKDALVSYKSARDFLTPTTLTQVAADLGVDAVIALNVQMAAGKEDKNMTVTATSGSHSTELTGNYVMHPKAVLNIALYEKTSAEPAWLREFVQGAPAEAGIHTTLGVEDRSEEPTAFVDAAHKAWLTAANNYDAASAPAAAK